MYSQYPQNRNTPGRHRFLRGGFFIAAVFLMGAIVMLLWNAILPAVTAAKPLSYWQAIGLLVLSRILFGGLRFGRPGWKNGHPGKYRAWREKWVNMSEEERIQFKEAWRRKCGKEEQE